MSTPNFNFLMSHSTSIHEDDTLNKKSFEATAVGSDHAISINQGQGGETQVALPPISQDEHEYVADEKNRRYSKAKLDAEYSRLLEEVNKVVEHNSGSRFIFIMHLLKMVLFWRDAEKNDIYLQELYQDGIPQKDGDEKKKTPKVFKKTVNHGINFAPMINVAWKNHPACDLVSKKTNRISRAMNDIHENYLHSKTYTEDQLKEVATEIIKKGGMNKLVKYGQTSAAAQSDENEIPDSSSDKILCKKDGSMNPAEKSTLFIESLTHYDNVTVLPTANFTKEISVDDDNLSMVLVRKNKFGEFKLIGQVTSKSQIENALVQQFSSDVTAVPRCMRVVTEMLLTQCLPSELQIHYKKLVDEAGKHPDQTAINAVRRLFYKYKSQTFVMSPIHALSGVVTIGKAKEHVFEDQDEIEEDLQLVTKSRRDLELNMIAPRNFRNFVALEQSNDQKIPTALGPYTHKVVLKTKKEKDLAKCISVQFGAESTALKSLRQVDVDIDTLNQKTPIWDRVVSEAWIKNFNNTFTNNWIKHHSKHITRAHQATIELEFGKSRVKVGFFNVRSEYDNRIEFTAPADAKSDTDSAFVLSKDFAIAMHGLNDLGFIEDVRIRLYSSMVRLSYSTEVANYELIIPRCNSFGNRLDNGFSEYRLISDDGYPEDSLYQQTEADLAKEFNPEIDPSYQTEEEMREEFK